MSQQLAWYLANHNWLVYTHGVITTTSSRRLVEMRSHATFVDGGEATKLTCA
jgi:hypothetical protein